MVLFEYEVTLGLLKRVQNQVFFTKMRRGTSITDRNITQKTYKKYKNFIVLSSTGPRNGVENKKTKKFEIELARPFVKKD